MVLEGRLRCVFSVSFLYLVTNTQAHPVGRDDAEHQRGGAAGGEGEQRRRQRGADGEKPVLLSPRRLLHDSGE